MRSECQDCAAPTTRKTVENGTVLEVCEDHYWARHKAWAERVLGGAPRLQLVRDEAAA